MIAKVVVPNRRLFPNKPPIIAPLYRVQLLYSYKYQTSSFSNYLYKLENWSQLSS